MPVVLRVFFLAVAIVRGKQEIVPHMKLIYYTWVYPLKLAEVNDMVVPERGTPEWKGPEHIGEQQRKFCEGMYERGLNQRQAALYAGASESSAHTLGSRWAGWSAVKEYIRDVYMTRTLSRKYYIEKLRMDMYQIAFDPKVSAQVRINAYTALMAYEKDPIFKVEEESNDNNSIRTLSETIARPVPTRTFEDVLGYKVDTPADTEGE